MTLPPSVFWLRIIVIFCNHLSFPRSALWIAASVYCLFNLLLFEAVAAHAEGADDINQVDKKAVTTSLGASGLPLPRFVSLKSGTVNVRRGPDQKLYPVSWIYKKRGLPVEIFAELDNWRRIRDADGYTGWVNQSLLSGKRTAMIAPWLREQRLPMRKSPSDEAKIVAKVAPGVIGTLRRCDGTWCEMEIKTHRGWFKQQQLWGVYPGEELK